MKSVILSHSAIAIASSLVLADDQAIGFASQLVLAEGDAPPEFVQLLPVGSFMGRDGQGPYVVGDAAHRDQIIAASQSALKGIDAVVDYCHQTDYAAIPGVGGTAAASGWITGYENRDDGIWGKVSWTARASQEIKGREYRYISPVFTHAKTGGRVGRIMRAALTNTPNLELKAVASQSTGEDGMTMGLILAALGLPATATAAEAVVSINSMNTSALAIATALGAKDKATTEDVVALAAQVQAKGIPDPAKYVPIESLTAVSSQLTAAKTEIATLTAKDREAAVDTAIAKLKIVPALRDWAISYAASDPAAFAKYVEAAPALGLSTEQINGGKKPGATDGALTAEEIAINAMLGVSEEDFVKSRTAMEAA